MQGHAAPNPEPLNPKPTPPLPAHRGTLNDALDRGWFRQERAATGAPNLTAILRTAVEIAGAVAYLVRAGVAAGVGVA